METWTLRRNSIAFCEVTTFIIGWPRAHSGMRGGRTRCLRHFPLAEWRNGVCSMEFSRYGLCASTTFDWNVVSLLKAERAYWSLRRTVLKTRQLQTPISTFHKARSSTYVYIPQNLKLDHLNLKLDNSWLTSSNNSITPWLIFTQSFNIWN